MLTIPRILATRLLGHAQSVPAQEVCGLIGSRNGQPVSIYRISNVASQPETEFELDPAMQVRAMKTMRERNEELLAVYHSHPAAPPVPSALDIERCGHPEALMFIISLNIKGVLEMRAYKRLGDSVEDIPLQVFLS